MAKARPNSGIQELRGGIDAWVYRHMFGQTVVSRRPLERGRKRTAAEAATNERFTKAVHWARLAPPELIARYDEIAARENKSKFSIRTRDSLVPPKIVAVYLAGYAGQPGEKILVIARDDFEVKEVRVAIRRPDGGLVESGPAARHPDDVFRYETSAAVPSGTEAAIEVTATDWPGNVTSWRSAWKIPSGDQA